jgi:hypothetical protein
MYIDIKIEVWERIKIPENLVKEFKTKVSNGEIADSANALIYLHHSAVIVPEILMNTEELISPENNHGQATFQVYDKNHNIVFSNDIEPEAAINHHKVGN